VDEAIGHYLTYDIAVMDTPTPTVYTPTTRTKVRRLRKRGVYDKARVHAILDEGIICHVGFVKDGQPYVIPTLYARAAETLYVHGSAVSRMLKSLAGGVDICVTVTLLDGYVLARSAFHHSMNFRSVMLFGTSSQVVEDEEKRAATAALLEHIAPGRSAHTRDPTAAELRAVLMVRIPIAEGSAKVRTGGPIDEPGDMGEPIWAGQIPLVTIAGAAIPDGVLPPGTWEPAYVRAYPARGGGES